MFELRPGRAPFAGFATVIGCALAALLLAGCGDKAPAVELKRPVTQAEAEKLATMRVKLFAGVGVHFHTVLRAVGEDLLLDGDVDYRNALGFAEASTVSESISLLWSSKGLQVWPDAKGSTTTPAKLPTLEAKGRALAPDSNGTDAVLSVMLKLGQPKPDSVNEILTNGALWLRKDLVGAIPVNVFKGPSAAGAPAPIYWLDAAGSLVRLELGFASDVLTSIDLDATKFKPIPS